MPSLEPDSEATATQDCPVCKAAVQPSKRYPNSVCRECVKRAVDRNGRRVAFENANTLTGLEGFYVGSQEPYPRQTCFIDSVPCFAQEAYLGGIVIQKLPEHPLLKLSFYDSLNSRQQENYNYQKLAGVLADFGFITHRLSDDWNGADMIAQHINGDSFIKIQLKGRLTFSKKYQGKDIWIAFRKYDNWYLYPHDAVMDVALSVTNIANTDSWTGAGAYSFPEIPDALVSTLLEYKIVYIL
jgi:hypothetical protein